MSGTRARLAGFGWLSLFYIPNAVGVLVFFTLNQGNERKMNYIGKTSIHFSDSMEVSCA